MQFFESRSKKNKQISMNERFIPRQVSKNNFNLFGVDKRAMTGLGFKADPRMRPDRESDAEADPESGNAPDVLDTVGMGHSFLLRVRTKGVSLCIIA